MRNHKQHIYKRIFLSHLKKTNKKLPLIGSVQICSSVPHWSKNRIRITKNARNMLLLGVPQVPHTRKVNKYIEYSERNYTEAVSAGVP